MHSREREISYFREINQPFLPAITLYTQFNPFLAGLLWISESNVIPGDVLAFMAISLPAAESHKSWPHSSQPLLGAIDRPSVKGQVESLLSSNYVSRNPCFPRRWWSYHVANASRDTVASQLVANCDEKGPRIPMLRDILFNTREKTIIVGEKIYQRETLETRDSIDKVLKSTREYARRFVNRCRVIKSQTS